MAKFIFVDSVESLVSKNNTIPPIIKLLNLLETTGNFVHLSLVFSPNWRKFQCSEEYSMTQQSIVWLQDESAMTEQKAGWQVL